MQVVSKKKGIIWDKDYPNEINILTGKPIKKGDEVGIVVDQKAIQKSKSFGQELIFVRYLEQEKKIQFDDIDVEIIVPDDITEHIEEELPETNDIHEFANDILNQTGTEIKSDLEGITDIGLANALLKAEKSGKNRKTIISAIQAKIKEME